MAPRNGPVERRAALSVFGCQVESLIGDLKPQLFGRTEYDLMGFRKILLLGSLPMWIFDDTAESVLVRRVKLQALSKLHHNVVRSVAWYVLMRIFRAYDSLTLQQYSIFTYRCPLVDQKLNDPVVVISGKATVDRPLSNINA